MHDSSLIQHRSSVKDSISKFKLKMKVAFVAAGFSPASYDLRASYVQCSRAGHPLQPMRCIRHPDPSAAVAVADSYGRRMLVPLRGTAATKSRRRLRFAGGTDVNQDFAAWSFNLVVRSRTWREVSSKLTPPSIISSATFTLSSMGICE